MVTGIAWVRDNDPEKGAPRDGVNKFIEANTAPKQWLKSGALVVEDVQGWETNNGYLRGCTQTVTIVFDAKHKRVGATCHREKVKNRY